MTLIQPVTPQLPVGPYMPPWEPLNGVTPFTYRDGTTYLRQLELLGVYVNETLVNFINQNFTELGTAFTTQVNALIANLNDHIDAQTAAVNAALQAEQDAVDVSIADLTTYVNEQVQAIITASIVVSDPVVYGILNNPVTQSRLLNDGLYAVPTGRVHANAADGSITQASLQAAADKALAEGKILDAYGTITTDTTTTIRCNADLSNLTINYTGAGTPVILGYAGGLTYHKAIIAPTVYAVNKTVIGWAQVAGTVGIRILNLNACQVFLPFIRNFETSVEVRGQGVGTVYNTVTLGQINNGKIGISFTADATGWSNQNTFQGGSLQQDSAEGDRNSGSRAILFTTSSNLPNANTFIGTSFEGKGWEYQIECFGLNNVFLNCRFETALGARVYWRATATRNSIIQGYGQVTSTYEAGAVRNNVDQFGYTRKVSATGTAVQVLQNDSSGSNAALVVVDPGVIEAGTDVTTVYDWLLSGVSLRGKRTGDAFDRLIASASNGTLLMGNGTAAPVAGVQGINTSLLVTAATLVFGGITDGATDLGARAGSRFNNAYLKGYVKPGSFSTAARPTGLVVADNGAMIYDTDLGKNIMWKNPNWVDLATGATV